MLKWLRNIAPDSQPYPWVKNYDNSSLKKTLIITNKASRLVNEIISFTNLEA